MRKMARRLFVLSLTLSSALMASPHMVFAHDAGVAHKHPHPHEGATAYLPAILSKHDAGLYREIFRLQENADFAAADKLIASLEDRMLLGHVLAQRYLHPTKYRASFEELKTWMAKYADHHDAKQLYSLARKRQPKGGHEPKLPDAGLGIVNQPDQALSLSSSSAKTPRHNQMTATWKKQIISQLRDGHTKAVKQMLLSLEGQKLFTTLEYDQASTKLAARYFTDGLDNEAVEWAGKAAKRSGLYVPEAGWTAGLASWRQRRFAEAAYYFEMVAHAPDISPWLISAGAFWAARSYLQDQQPQKYASLLAIAADYPKTFYGILARRLLGLSMPFQWTKPEIKQSMVDQLAATVKGRRALALVQAGNTHRAERELGGMTIPADSSLAESIMTIASHFGMPFLAMRLAEGIASDDAVYDSISYPLPQWNGNVSYSVDRALVYALVRQESGFNPKAKSPAGARGLMQIMPHTASFVARDKRIAKSKTDTLYKPELNLDLGQKYIEMLLKNDAINGNMFLMAAAWNGGPGNLSKWRRAVDHMDDSLFFIESLPSRETRIFIERVFSNLWIYHNRLGQPTPSLDAIAAGKWPHYIAQDGDPLQIAENDENRR